MKSVERQDRQRKPVINVAPEMKLQDSGESDLQNRTVYRDGIHEQIVILDKLSQKLDEYFALRLIKTDAWR